jgi:hypothetical protein
MADEGEQRCHGSGNVGRPAVDLTVQAWNTISRPQTHCQTNHHLSNKEVKDLEWARAHLSVTCLRLEESGLTEVTLFLSEEERRAYRSVATPWEWKRSSLFNTAPVEKSVSPFLSNTLHPATPVLDDINTVIAYVGKEVTDNIYLKTYDINGNQLGSQLIGNRPIESDEFGNALVAAIVTLGPGLVRVLATSVIPRLGAVMTAAAINAAKGISPQAHRLTLLFLRSLRARAIVQTFRTAGKDVVVNVGGEAGPEELAKWGEQIALNDQVRMGVAKRYVPRLIKENGENIGQVFERETVDRVVSRRLDQGFDVDRVAQGAHKVLRPGGKVEMEIFSPDAKFAESFAKALTKAGFKNVEREQIGQVFTGRFLAIK